MGVDEFGFEARGLKALLEVVEEAADAGAEGGDLDGFGEVVAGPEADGLDGGLRGVVAGQEKDVGGGGSGEDFACEREAGAAGEEEVEDDNGGAFGEDGGHGFVGVGGREDADGQGTERVGEEFAGERVIVHGEDGDGWGQASSG
jgi:hypothetical protein